MTPSVHLSTESEYDQEREPVEIPKDLFDSSKGKFTDVFGLCLYLVIATKSHFAMHLIYDMYYVCI